MLIKLHHQWVAGEALLTKVGNVWREVDELSHHNQGWKVAYRAQDVYTYQVRVGYFYASQLWYGFFRDGTPDPGVANPKDFEGWVLRDLNAPVDVPLRFQFGLFDRALVDRLTHVKVGDLPLLPYIDAQKTGDSVARHYFSDGVTNVFAYLQSRLNQTITIKIYRDRG